MNQKVNPYTINKQSKAAPDVCSEPSCPHYKVRYCRLHKSFKVKEQKEIAKESDRMKAALKEYNKRCGPFKKENPVCKANIEGHCTKKTTDVHHMIGRASVEDLLNEQFWLPVCRACHNIIGENSAWAIQMGFSKPRLSQPVKNQKILYKKAS